MYVVVYSPKWKLKSIDMHCRPLLEARDERALQVDPAQARPEVVKRWLRVGILDQNVKQLPNPGQCVHGSVTREEKAEKPGTDVVSTAHHYSSIDYFKLLII